MHEHGVGALHPMNFDFGSADSSLRDWAIAFVICMVVMFWTRIFRLAAAESGHEGAACPAKSVAGSRAAEPKPDVPKPD